jgi:hypothetical protein
MREIEAAGTVLSRAPYEQGRTSQSCGLEIRIQRPPPIRLPRLISAAKSGKYKQTPLALLWLRPGFVSYRKLHNPRANV